MNGLRKSAASMLVRIRFFLLHVGFSEPRRAGCGLIRAINRLTLVMQCMIFMAVMMAAMPAASIELVKNGTFNDESNDGFAQVGETISYTFDVTNTDNVTITNVAVTDPMVAPITCPSGNPIPSLAPAASETCTGTYAVVQMDVDAGQKINTATVTSNETLPASDSTIVDLPASPPNASKSGNMVMDNDNSGNLSPGDRLTYTIDITNTGDNNALNAFFDDTPDPNTTLISGSVTTSQGTVTVGNNPGDTSVSIAIGTIPALAGQVTVGFDVLINDPFPAGEIEVINQGVVSGSNFPDANTDDPDTQVDGDPTVDAVYTAFAIPTLSDWGKALFLLLLAALSLWRLRKKHLAA